MVNTIRDELNRLLSSYYSLPSKIKRLRRLEACRVIIRTAIKDGIDVSSLIPQIDEIDRRQKDNK